MSLEVCRKIDFETTADGSKRCRRFDDECPECLCEKFSVGENSPGIVDQNELLIRFHFDPADIGENQKPTPNAFTDVISVGFSVTRDGASNDLILSVVADRLRKMNHPNSWHSVSVARAAEVRDIFRMQTNPKTKESLRPERAYCVYDTAEPNNLMHAEICATKAGAARLQKQRLRAVFTHIRKDDFRSGVFSGAGLGQSKLSSNAEEKP